MYLISRFRFLMVVACLTLASSLTAFAGEPPTDPILRINAGEHTGNIRDIATDDRGRWLVTASQDKSAKVWDAREGSLQRTLRIPIGDGWEGELNALAFSPDGNTVAVGGITTQFNTGLASLVGGGMNVYLFDRASGRLLRRLTGVHTTVIHLAFSPDGRMLAAVDGKGVYLFSVADGRLIAQDTDYGGPSYSVHFSRNGRLVTSSWDGLIRLYSFDGTQMALIAKCAAPGGKQPGAARFSPDGSRIAVGYLDTIAVNVLDGRDLSLRYSPSTVGVVMGPHVGLFEIAWSHDGTFLYAAGDSKKIISGKEQHFIRRWAGSGAGAAQDWPVPAGNITYLVALPDNRLAFSSAEASWGVLTANGSLQMFHAPAVANFRGTQDRLMLSADGTRLAFCYEPACKQMVSFNTVSPSLNVADTAGLMPPRISAPGLDITGWNSSSYDPPRLNGSPLAVKQQGYTSSLAILPNGEGFALGSELALRMFDRSGRQLWERHSFSGVFAVNVSQDGRWVVAAYGDGTIRWHRVSDGAEQLAFYPYPDRRRWIMWTPSGYYNASPGAEDLVGWHVNRGIDQAADFYPVSQFRDRFYRPDAIAKVIETSDEAAAVKEANAAASRREPIVSVAQILPPVVELVSAPQRFASATVPISIRVRTPSDAPLTGLRVLVNGEIMATPRSTEPVQNDGTQELTLALPAKDSEVNIYADNKNARSLPLTLTLQWAGDSKVFATGEQGSHKTQKPKLWLLAVGVSAYRTPGVQHLNYASDDAKAFASLLTAQQGKAYREVEARVLTDDQATRANILAGLDWLKSQVGAGDVGIVFLAGHGFTMATDHRYYYAAVDVDVNRLTDTGVSYAAIQKALTDFNGRGDGTRAIFFIDTCHSGDATGASIAAPVKASNGDALAGELTRTDNQVLVFASSKGNEFSWEDASFRHGAFTEALIEGLGDEWQADPRKTGRVTYKNLDAWISDRVPVITQGRQTPRLMMPPGGVDDFVLGSK